MKTLILLLVAGLMAGCAGSRAASGTASEDDGYRQFKRTCPYSEADCKREWRDKKGDEMSARYTEEARARAAADRERRKEEAAQREAKIAEDRRKREAENAAAIERTNKMLEANAREERAAQNAAAKREQEAKARCGDDYRQPKIGMSIARAQECVGKFRMTNQINRADGVISTYQGSGMYLHVMDNRVVSWGKY